jgi:hypothetical protein
MSFGVQTLNQYGQEEFNSSAEHTLFLVYEQVIAGNSVGSSGLFLCFPITPACRFLQISFRRIRTGTLMAGQC